MKASNRSTSSVIIHSIFSSSRGPLYSTSKSMSSSPPSTLSVFCKHFITVVLMTLHCAIPAIYSMPTTSLIPNVTSLSFVVGETAVVECQIDVENALAADVELVWYDPQNKSISLDPSHRMFASEKFVSGQTSQLLSLIVTLTSLTSEDAGTYRCESSLKNATERSQSSITLHVSDEHGRCGFESATLCGWTVSGGNGSSSSWILHGGANDPTHADHTYWPSTSVGHCMSVTLQPANRSLSKPSMLTSPIMSSTSSKAICVRFWYIIQGEAILVVQLKSNEGNASMTALKEISSSSATTASDGEWKLATFGVNSFTPDSYKVHLSAYVRECDMCGNATVFVDDILVTPTDCPGNIIDKPTSSSNLKFEPSKSASKPTAALSTASKSTSSSSIISVDSTSTVSSTTEASAQPVFQPSKTDATVLKPTANATTQTPTTITTQPATTKIKTTVKTTKPMMTTMMNNSPASIGDGVVDQDKTTSREKDTATGTTATTSALVSNSLEDGVLNETADDEGPADGPSGSDGGNNAGLAIGIVLAVLSAGACTAAVLYRRKRRGRKSTYITFGNPSYSREHLPANDFSLDSPLTLSSNGYTVLA